MSQRTIQSRPRRLHNGAEPTPPDRPPVDRRRGRAAILALVVIGVSACSAVAADRLPGATTTDVRTAPAAPTADPSPVA
ncbi:MAG: hypothetical protein AAGA93_28770, partial [Actinomycetota bacterium]